MKVAGRLRDARPPDGTPIRQDQQEAAGRTVKTRMLVAAVVEKEKIKASDEDLEKQIKVFLSYTVLIP